MPDLFKDTLTLQDAVKITGPRAFHLMLKPAGSLCNLDCNYCYYLDKAEIYGGREPRMSPEMLETVIRKYIEANDVPEVQFNWHGGEPTLLGLDFYRRAVELEKKYAGDKQVFNTIQTNGTLIDADWARFLRENDFLVGVSIDGPRDIHDRYRKDKGARPTFDKVIEGIRILNGEGVRFNTMSTVNNASRGRGLEVYQFLKSLGGLYQQYMPVVEHVKYPLGPKGEQNRKALLNDDGSLTERSHKVLNKTPMGRFGDISELNGIVRFLASDEASFVTGTIIPVDGGFSSFSGV